jgi:RNA-dependent RNA polymerase
LKLALLASQAVDFPKTGTPVEFGDIPKLPPNTRRPDFLCPEGSNPDPKRFYQSQKVLGMLFRSVPTENRHDEDEIRASPPVDDRTITEALSRLRSEVSQLPELPDPSQELWREMVFILHQYTEQLSNIARANSFSKHHHHSLTEAELVSGTIESTWSNNQRGRQEAMTAMNFQASQTEIYVFESLRFGY